MMMMVVVMMVTVMMTMVVVVMMVHFSRSRGSWWRNGHRHGSKSGKGKREAQREQQFLNGHFVYLAGIRGVFISRHHLWVPKEGGQHQCRNACKIG